MARFKVDTYAAEWNPKTNIGRIIVTVGPKKFPLPIDNAAEFATTMLILSKSGVLVDTDQWDLELPSRSVGT